MPLLLLITIGGVQVAMWFQARNICQAAAQTGVRHARVLGAPDGAGSAAAADYLTTVGGGSVVGGHAVQSQTATSVTVTCTGQAIRVIPLPGFSISVSQSSTEQRERFTTPGTP
jgi:Flp pilus assembly protein TadG